LKIIFGENEINFVNCKHDNKRKISDGRKYI